MERLTERYCDGLIRIKHCSTAFSDTPRNGAFLHNAIIRLAEYEDTELEPEVCSEYKKFEDEAISNGVTFKRIVELMQAEKDGRLVVLPDAKYTDVDGEKALQKAMWVCGNTNNPVTRYTADAIAEKLCREVKEENPPLTLKELQEMEGEPVWIARLDDPGESNWHLIGGYNRDRLLFRCEYRGLKYGGCMDWDEMGATWLAYRRKPEEGV